MLTYTIKPNIYGGYICGRFKIPYIVNITGLGSSIENSSKFKRKIMLWMYKKGLKKATKVFFQNEYNKKVFENNNLVNCNTELIPGSGVNLEKHCFEEYTNNKNINFLFIGRLMKEKGLNEFLEATKIIKSKYNNVEFNVIGGYQEQYYDIITDLHNKGIIKYNGVQQDVHSFIKQADATILPSYHEGISNVLLETAACGRPILATNIPGCKETFIDNETGIGFKKKNTQDLIRAIEKFLSLTYEERKIMGKKGREKIEKEFDRNIVINAYINSINKILNKEIKQ